MRRASPRCSTALDRANAVHVALHDMSAQPVADAQRTLEVHAAHRRSTSPIVVRSSVVVDGGDGEPAAGRARAR